MTRWQKAGWALGYSLLTVYGVIVWFAGTDLFHYFGASSLIYGFGLGAYAENDIISILSFLNFLLILAGLVIVPILAAFRWRVPLYVLMGMDVLGRILLLVSRLLARDTYMLGHIVAGLILAVGVLVVTVHLLRKPDVTPEMAKL